MSHCGHGALRARTLEIAAPEVACPRGTRGDTQVRGRSMLAATSAVSFLAVLAYVPIIKLMPKKPRDPKEVEGAAARTGPSARPRLLPRAAASHVAAGEAPSLSLATCACLLAHACFNPPPPPPLPPSPLTPHPPHLSPLVRVCFACVCCAPSPPLPPPPPSQKAKMEDLSVYEKMTDLEYAALPLEVNDQVIRHYLEYAAATAITATATAGSSSAGAADIASHWRESAQTISDRQSREAVTTSASSIDRAGLTCRTPRAARASRVSRAGRASRRASSRGARTSRSAPPSASAAPERSATSSTCRGSCSSSSLIATR